MIDDVAVPDITRAYRCKEGVFWLPVDRCEPGTYPCRLVGHRFDGVLPALFILIRSCQGVGDQIVINRQLLDGIVTREGNEGIRRVSSIQYQPVCFIPGYIYVLPADQL